jgi:exosortase/archaeosortase family protein
MLARLQPATLIAPAYLRLGVGARAGLALTLIAIAYHYSIGTLLRSLTLATPLAYLGLVPGIALALALLRAVPGPEEPNIHDRQLDYIVGFPLLLMALLVAWALPIQQSTFFWLWRIDLLSLPMFVAGVVAIVFGVRALWRIRAGIGFLLLAWPIPYLSALGHGLRAFTDTTLSGLDATLRVLPLAQPVKGMDGSLFSLVHNGDLFVVSVASECSGVNGFVGFLIVGTAMILVLQGSLGRKIAWLVSGLLLMWVINLARILIVFEVGRSLGPSVALNWLHPFFGLVTFNIGVLVMAFLAPAFGLAFALSAGKATSTGSPVGRQRHRPTVGGRAAIGIVLVATLAACVLNERLQQYELVAHEMGTPRLSGFSEANASVAGWSLQQSDTYPSIRQFLGDDAAWVRYAYTPQPSVAEATLRAATPVVMDVMNTADRTSLSAFGLEACYQFHHYQIVDAHRVGLAGGVVGNQLAYRNPADNRGWVVVYWEWPIVTGAQERYERVVLSVREDGTIWQAPPLAPGGISAPELAMGDWLSGTSLPPVSPQLSRARQFLVGFAQQVIASSAAHESRAAANSRGGSA